MTLYGAGGNLAAKLTADADGEPSSLMLYGGTTKPMVTIAGYGDGGHVALSGSKGFPATLIDGNSINVLSEGGVNSMLVGFAGGVPQVSLVNPKTGSRASLFATPERAWLELRRKSGSASVTVMAGKSPVIQVTEGKKTTSFNLLDRSPRLRRNHGHQAPDNQ
jgi:hypothetical protein